MPAKSETVARVINEIRASLRDLDEGLMRFADLIETQRDESDFDAGMAEARAGRIWPRDVVKRLVAGEHPIKVFREYRGMTQGTLARAAGTATNYISQIETGKRDPGRSFRLGIAEALRVDPSAIDPWP